MTIPADRLYAIIDAGASDAPTDLAEHALGFGCGMLQLRAKHLDDRTSFETARTLRNRCRAASVPFIVNDRPDLAVLVGADGLHLGQEDLPIADARRIVGALQIGISTHSFAQAVAAEDAGADLIAFGPIFGTTSKVDPDPVVGLRALGRVCSRVRAPVVAIGGITPENAASVLEEGADRVAVISALPRFVG